MAVTGLLSFGVTSVALATTISRYQRIDAAFYSVAFIIAGLVGGWALASSLLGSLAKSPAPVSPPAVPVEDVGSSAVIVTSCFEPAQYSARSTAMMLQALVAEDLLGLSLGTTPFLFFAQKARYRAVGGTSPAARQLRDIAERLEPSLADAGVGLVDWAACSGDRRLAARVADAAAAGHRRIVVVDLTVGASLQLSAAKQETDSLHLAGEGVQIVYTEALGNCDPIAAALTRRVMEASGNTEETGVVLVGHGQPEPRARRNPEMDEQETSFLNRMRMMLLEKGLPESNVRVAWSDWREPDVTSSVRHLAALGCRRVVVVPAVYPVDTLTTRLDLEMSARQARVDEAVTVVTLPAWRDDEAVMGELTKRVRNALER